MNTFEHEAAIVATKAIDRARRPTCSGDACKQGKRKCTTPQACQIPEEADDDGLSDMLAAGVVCLVSCIAIVAAVAAIV